MRHVAHRATVLAVLICSSLILAVGIAASAGAGTGTVLPSWVQVFTWSGGGEGNDIRNSASFTLQGGEQVFRASTRAVPGEYSWPSAGWTVEPAADGYEFEMIDVPDMGQSVSYLYLSAGSYFVHCNTLDCTWTIAISELSPEAPEIAGLTRASGRRGATVTITGSGFGATRGASSVKFGAVKCTKYLSWSATKATCRVPAQAKYGKVNVILRTTVGTSNVVRFTVKR